MSTIKLMLRTAKTNSAGEAPICIRIIKNRVAKFIFLDYRVKPEFWDEEERRVKKSHPNSKQLNCFLAQKIAEAEAASLNLESKDKSVASVKIKQELKGKAPLSFIEYFNRYLIELTNNGQIGTYNKAKAVLSKLNEYLNGKDLSFDEITVSWLKIYESYLRITLKNSVNTIHSNLKIIRRLINSAISVDIIPFEKNPFLRYKLKWENVPKEFLTEDELSALEKLELQKNSKKDHHRNMYLFAANTGGLRISDILQLRWKNFDGQNLTVKTQKTGSIVSIKLPNKSIELLDNYVCEESKPEDFIFPILKNDIDYTDKGVLFKAISSATAYTNTDLRDFEKSLEFTKHINFHTSRHTWATRALRKGMRIEYVSKLMGHGSIKVTQGYAKIVNDDLDKAMEVFN